jgi:hypothetical protein
MIHEQDPVQMIDLVLQAAGEQALGFDLLGLAAAVEVAHADPVGARDLAELLGQAEAAFLREGHALGTPDQLGIDHEPRRTLAVLAEVEDERPLEHADLGGREPDPGCCVHGLEHGVEQAQELGVDALDRGAHRRQAAVGRFQDLERGHRYRRHGQGARHLGTRRSAVKRDRRCRPGPAGAP